MWEDPANEKGGRVQFRMGKPYANKFWEELTLAMIGDEFPLEVSVNGVTATIHPDRIAISVWVGDCTNFPVV